jgi:hypothetical protein
VQNLTQGRPGIGFVVHDEDAAARGHRSTG